MNCKPNDLARVVRDRGYTEAGGLWRIPPDLIDTHVVVTQVFQTYDRVWMWHLDEPVTLTPVGYGIVTANGQVVPPGVPLLVNALPDGCLEPVRPGRAGVTTPTERPVTA